MFFKVGVFNMKRLIIFLIVAVFLASCGKHSDITDCQMHTNTELLHIDFLMQYDADSALMCLMSFRPERNEMERSGEISSIFNENYHSLLLSEALYKTDNPQNRIELQTAMHYFDSLAEKHPQNDDITLLSARSHYMNGVGYYENDSVVEACKEYLKTLEIMEGNFDVDKLTGFRAKFIGLTYSRLGEIFSNNGMGTSAIESYKISIKFLSRLPNYSLANINRRIGLSYMLDNLNNDSALYYYRKSICLSTKENKTHVLNCAISEAAPLYYDLGYKDSALIMIRTALSSSSDEDLYLARCFTYGSILTQECLYDSAIFYLKKSINRNWFATQTVSAELLMKCYQALGDTVKMRYYKNLYGEDLDEYRNVLPLKDELATVYDSYKQNHLQKEHSRQIKKQIISSIVFSVLIITAIAVAVIHNRNKINKVKKKSHDDIKEKDKALAEMKRKMEANPFINEPICKSILETVNKRQFKTRVPFTAYKEYALSKEQLLALKDAMDRHYDNFTQWICKDYSELTTDDIDYLCLYHLGLKDTEIFVLMQRAYPTVGERSRKLKRIFNSNKPLNDIIKNIIELHHKLS